MANSTPAFPDDLVIYQIYPRSFKDASGDGVGDLAGIIAKLDYLQDLGVTAIWLTPIHPSSNYDFGYDVTDYLSVDPLFGDLSTLDKLISEAHKRKIQVLLDQVFNHTSIDHPWFKESRASRENPKRDWYIWRDAKPDGSPPNNWLSVFGGPAWTLDEASGQYYLHTFLKQQPGLNWHNPSVREAIKDVARFWLDRGVDGFRMDAVNYYAKDRQLRDDPPNPDYDPAKDKPYDALEHSHSYSQPEMYHYQNEIASVLASYKNRFMVMEAYPGDPLEPIGYDEFYKNVNCLVAAPFNFELQFLSWNAASFKSHIDDYQASLRANFTPIYVFGNHDQPRLASRYGIEAMPAAALLLLTLPGRPVIYYGEEIGMTNVDIPEKLRVDNGPERDGFRTPMQWSSVKNADFTSASPWLPLGNDIASVNVASELADSNSLLNLYRQLLKLRKSSSALASGSYEPLASTSKDVFGFQRIDENEKLAIVINFSKSSPAKLEIEGEIVLSTIGPKHNSGQLAPSEAVILKLA